MIPTSSACRPLLLRRTLRSPCIPKRSNSSSPNSATPPPQHSTPSPTTSPTPKTIPGPSWLWLQPIATPFRAYGRVAERRPYATQLTSSLIIYLVGDICAQRIATPVPSNNAPTGGSDATASPGEEKPNKRQHDYLRTLRALTIGGISSIPSYTWFIWLGNSFNYSSVILSLATKVVVNQIVFTPIFNSYFFGMQSLLTGATLEEVVERIKHTVPVSWVNSCKIWPAVTAFSFWAVPVQFRSIFGGVIAIGWQTYLSLLNQRAAAQERMEHEQSQDVSVETQSQNEQRAEA